MPKTNSKRHWQNSILLMMNSAIDKYNMVNTVKVGPSFFFGLLMALLLFTTPELAKAQNAETHTVKQGETLYSISRKYDITLENLRNWNDLEGNEINVGQQLIVKPGGEYRTHTVQRGETLFSIAQQYQVSISELKAWNQLDNDILKVGQKLIVRDSVSEKIARDERLEKTTSDSTQSLILQSEQSPKKNYIVKSGDTLYQIARQFGMSVQELKALNDLSGNTISVGQRITVTAPPEPSKVVQAEGSDISAQGSFIQYRLKEDEEYLQLLQKFRMDSVELAALNPNFNIPKLEDGDLITVLTPPKNRLKNPYRIKARLKTLGDIEASKYDTSEIANTTTSGDLYNPEALTAAHATIVLGSVIYIEEPQSGRGCFVRINDRITGNGIKLSTSAFDALNLQDAQQPRVKLYKETEE